MQMAGLSGASSPQQSTAPVASVQDAAGRWAQGRACSELAVNRAAPSSHSSQQGNVMLRHMPHPMHVEQAALPKPRAAAGLTRQALGVAGVVGATNLRAQAVVIAATINTGPIAPVLGRCRSGLQKLSCALVGWGGSGRQQSAGGTSRGVGMQRSTEDHPCVTAVVALASKLRSRHSGTPAQ